MQTVEKEARTSQEAVEEALLELGARRGEVEVEVLREASGGFLGIGRKNARVRVSLKRGGGGKERAAAASPEETMEEAVKATKEILDFIGIKHSVKTSETDSAIEVDLEVEESQGLLIGKYGETLRNLEYVVSRIAAAKTGGQPNRGKRISIDVNGYKRDREKDIEKKAVEAAKKVIQSGRPFTFHRMQSYERKVVYTAIKSMSGVRYETKEDGNAKKITLLPEGGEKNGGY